MQPKFIENILDISFKWFDVGRATHCFCFDDMVIKQHLNLVNS